MHKDYLVISETIYAYKDDERIALGQGDKVIILNPVELVKFFDFVTKKP